MNKKLIIYPLAFAMFTSACSPRGSESSAPPAPAAVVDKKGTDMTAWNAMLALVNTEHGNLPLAEALVHLLQDQNPEALNTLRRQMESGTKLIIDEGSNTQWAAAKQNLLVGASTMGSDTEMLSRTLNLDPGELERSRSFDQQLKLKVAGVAQSLAMHDLLSTFNQQVASDSADVAVDLVSQLNQSNPEILKKIDATKNIRKREDQVDKIVLYLQQADALLSRYQFDSSKENRELLCRSIAIYLARVLSQQSSVKNLILPAQDALTVSNKIVRILALTQSVEKFGQNMAADARVMSQSVGDIYQKISALKNDVDLTKTLSDFDIKTAHAVLDGLLNGPFPSVNAPPDSGLNGFYAKKQLIVDDVNSFMSSADRSSRSLENIVLVTREITGVMGVKMDPGVEKVLQTATTISKGIQAVSAISTAFQAGGLVSAMAAFSGGPATMALAAFGGMSAMGGGNDNSAVLAELDKIKSSLEEIKQTEKKIIENQKQTMAMIKDLAMIIQENHREEMMALSDIRDDVANAKDGLTNIDEKNFLACGALTSFALNKADKGLAAYNKSQEIYAFSVDFMDSMRATIHDTTGSLEELQQFISNNSPENFKSCQQALSNSFTMRDLSNREFNRAIWIENKGGVVRDGADIAKNLYAPAFSYLQQLTINKNQNWQEMALHLPVAMVQDLANKETHLIQPAKEKSSTLSSLETLTATNRLEKYVTGLLVMYPYTSIDKEVWMLSLDDILKVGMSDQTRIRSQQMLRNALERVQIAIAQEAILSGEPLIRSLSNRWSEIASEQAPCDSVSKPFFCFVRTNNILVQNLLTYNLIKSMGLPMQNTPEIIAQRRARYAAYSADDLAKILGVEVSRITKQGLRWTLSVTKTADGTSLSRVELPELETIAQGQILYTEAMLRMVKLEHKVADELLKVSGTSFQKGSPDKIAAALFLK